MISEMRRWCGVALGIAALGIAVTSAGCGGGSSSGGPTDGGTHHGGAGGSSSNAGTGGGGGGHAGGGSGGTGGGAAMFTIGGTVSGLSGSGLVLRNNGGDDLAVDAGGRFTFATKVAAGSAFEVTVGTQPTSPSQTCIVSSPTNVANQDVSEVAVTCVTNEYRVGGKVSGLRGTGLVLKNNGGDDLPVSDNGAFTFSTAVPSGATFTVTVGSQPGGLEENCVVSGGSGTVGGADVTSVAVSCFTASFAVGGTVTGLAGAGLVLENGGSDDLPVSANGSFAFATPVDSGNAFAVTVKTQPSSPSQTCIVAGGAGVVASAPVTTVTVTCTTDRHKVGGTVSGLVGGSLVLQNSQGDSLAVTANGAFTFATSVASGAPYAVTVLTQPSSPTQTCAVANGTGTITSADVTGVAVTCTTNSYAVGGTVVGLAGPGLVLRNNGSDDLTLSSDGAFSFSKPVASGAMFQVTVGAQPTSPAQHCSVLGGQGAVGAAPVTSVVVNCATNQYLVGGDVTGLLGTGLQLSLNGGAALSVGADGTFAFSSPVASGAAYSVVVVGQPASPWQTCTVAGGTGTVGAVDVASVHVSCVTDKHRIGGVVTGLSGTGLVLRDNGGDDLMVGSSGAFTFATRVASGQGYQVTVAAQPTSPSQTCTVTAGSGAVGNADITNVAVSCVTNTYSVGGTLTGLAGSVALLNGSDTLNLTANGAFTFPTRVPSGGPYAVTVASQPLSPSQTCTVTNGSGSIVSGNISTVSISCVTNTFNVGGTVSGIVGTGLVLQNKAGDDLTINTNGAFHFATPVASGDTYAVTIKTQPSGPSQTCTLSGGSGTIGSAEVSSVSVNCATNAFTVGGTVTGFAGSGLVLTNNGVDDLQVSGNGSFAFASAVPSGGAYAVAVKAQPTSPWQTCTVTAGSGTIGSSPASSVAVNCVTNAYSVSVTANGLAGTGLVLQDNGADNLSVAASGTSTFATKVASGQPYAVTVLSQPKTPWQFCTVASPSGVVAGSNITLTMTCTTNTYTVSVTTSGFAGSGLVLQNNGADNLSVPGNGTLTFPTSVASGAGYAVTVKTQPSSPTQTCVVGSGSGTMAGANVNSVTVTCTTNTYKVGGTVTALVGSGLVLQNNAGDDLPVSANGAFTFATRVASGSGYAVTIKTQPSSPAQTCTVSAGSGTVGGADINNVVVNCSTNTYTVGGTVTGLAGSGLVLQNNGGNDVAISGNGNFAFSTPIASGATYAVTVKTQPNTPTQTCTVTNGSGNMGSSNVTSMAVSCATNTYAVSVAVSGLAGSGLVLQNNGGDNLSVTANGTKAFAIKVASGGGYSVSVLTQPSTPVQTCSVTSPTGTVGAANVTVTVTCVTNSYSIGGTIAGLYGAGLVLQDNAADDLGISVGATSFTFATKIANGSGYAVSVKTNPAGQLCVVANGSGTVGTTNITNVTVTCTIANGTYKVLARHSAKALDVEAMGTTDGSNVHQWTYNATDNQKWTLTHLGGNVYQLIGVQSGKAVEVASTSTADGTNVDIRGYTGASNQKWLMSPTDSGYYRLTPMSSLGSALDVTGNSTADGANIEQWTWHSAFNQQWIFQAP